MKKHSTVLLVVLFVGALHAGNVEQHSFPFDDMRILELKMKAGGNLDIEGWDQPRVVVSYEGRGGGEIGLDSRVRGDRLVIESRAKSKKGYRKHGPSQVDIKVPNGVILEINSSGGNLSIADLQAKISGRSMGGNVLARNLIASLDFETMGGNVEFESSELAGRVKTMGGNMNYQNVIGTLTSETMGGNIVFNNQGTIEGMTLVDPVVMELKTMGGNITLDEAPKGADLGTMGGNIKVDFVSEFLEAETMGGNITVKELDGWMRGETMGGDVSVNMIGDPELGNRSVELSSEGGDITLLVPENLSMDIEIELVYTKRSKQKFEIINDFGLEPRESAEWHYKNGEARKTITASGSINGGEHAIRIRTVNGHVRLQRTKMN